MNEAAEALNSHSVGPSSHGSKGPSGFIYREIYLPWGCSKPTKLEFVTFGSLVAEKR